MIEDAHEPLINCSAFITCNNCAGPSACSWTFVKQMCRDLSNYSGDDGPIKYSRWMCPEFTPTLVKVGTREYRRYSVMVTVSHGPASVKAHLRNSTIVCDVNGVIRNGAMSEDGAIECDPDPYTVGPPTTSYDRVNALHVARFDVFVDGVPLNLDDPAAHYVSAYEYPCDDQRCVVGVWDADDGPAGRKYHHYCRWCARNFGCAVREQQSKCVAWEADTGNGSAIDLTGGRVLVRSPAAAVESFRPNMAMAMADTVVTVTVRGHSVLADGRAVAVTVVGRPCVLAAAPADGGGPAGRPRPAEDGDDQLTCVVSAAKSTARAKRDVDDDSGPVEVTYSSAGTDYVLRSDAERSPFRFVWPDIRSVRPTCGSAAGGTVLTLLGDRLDVLADNSTLRVNTGGTDCRIVEHGPERIVCVTGAAPNPGAVPVWVDFGNGFATGVSQMMFEFAAAPFIAEDQTLTSIASGGIGLLIRGEFACVERPTINVAYRETDAYESCWQPADSQSTWLACHTPPVDLGPGPVRYPVDVPFWLHVRSGEFEHKLPKSRFRVYADPVFAGFHVTDRTVIVSDTRGDVGYRAADLTITALNGTVPCTVASADGGRIECVLPDAPPAGVEFELTVAVGRNLVRTVGRKGTAGAQSAAAGTADHAVHRLRIAIVLSGLSVVSVFVALVFGLLFCYRIMLANSKQQTEKRYLEELRNIAAAADKPF